jgi:hypothetical protein
MIETIILAHLKTELDMNNVFMEVPRDNLPTRFIVIEKTGGERQNLINTSTFAVQSYAESLYEAAALNELTKAAMDSLVEEDEIARSAYQTDYNFTDTKTKRYRYQAVYDITHYE